MPFTFRQLALCLFIGVSLAACGGGTNQVEEVSEPQLAPLPETDSSSVGDHGSSDSNDGGDTDQGYTSDNPNNEHVPYRYLENDGLFMYYETEEESIYRQLLPEIFDMPDRLLIFAFINDFYKLDFDAVPYKENAIFVLAKYQGKEVWHCIYMPVTDEHSLWAGVIGLGLPKSLGTIEFDKTPPNYNAIAYGQFGGEMRLTMDTHDVEITQEQKQEMIDLSLIPSLNIRNGNVIEMGRTGEQASILEIADSFPHLVTVNYGNIDIQTDTDTITVAHALDLKPSRILGAYYLHNKIPFSLTGTSVQ